MYPKIKIFGSHHVDLCPVLLWSEKIVCCPKPTKSSFIVPTRLGAFCRRIIPDKGEGIMSEDEGDEDLLALLRQSLGIGPSQDAAPQTRVLESAEYIYDNAIDVAIDSASTKAAASTIWRLMQEQQYTTQTWSSHELHPQSKDQNTVDFIFTMDLLNFCFWSEKSADHRFAVDYKGKKWTGYWSLVASMHRALDEG